jgi:hypothetical protein
LVTKITSNHSVVLQHKVVRALRDISGDGLAPC